MRVALPTWAGRVSPVFDVAREILILDVGEQGISHRQTAPLRDAGVTRRVDDLTKLGVEVLICGAISRHLETMLLSSGLRVIPHVCGETEQVIEAFLAGRLESDSSLRSPGCRGPENAPAPIGRGRRGNCRGRRVRTPGPDSETVKGRNHENCSDSGESEPGLGS